MPATVLTVTTIDRSYGANDVYANPSVTADSVNSNSFVNDGNTFLDILGATATTTMTVLFANAVDGVVGGRAYSILSTDHKLLGPFPTGTYGTTVTITWSAANPKIAVWRFTPNT